jgi:hypothetical protein
MSEMNLDPRISDELKALLDSGAASGALMTVTQIDNQVALFRARFGLEVL